MRTSGPGGANDEYLLIDPKAYTINAAFFENYWNAGSQKLQERYFDNIVISEERIGCGCNGVGAMIAFPTPSRMSRPSFPIVSTTETWTALAMAPQSVFWKPYRKAKRATERSGLRRLE